MANRRKDERNADIVRRYDDGKGDLQKVIAADLKVSEGVVAMVIHRDKIRKQKQEREALR